MTIQPGKLRMGMVGGGRDAFIGAVHRTAAALDGHVDFVAGALSSSPDKAIASGQDLGIAVSRNYRDWQQMIDAEAALPAGERIDFVSIVTPNDSHAQIAEAFLIAGFHVICDKPLCHNSDQATRLIDAVERSDRVFAVTYNYSGYPMIQEARDLVQQGALGEIRKVIVEYHQGWLGTGLEDSGHKQAAWRTDPARSGVGGAIGDIGSHAEQLVTYVTQLQLQSICADLTTFVPGRRLDDDATVLLRFSSGARGLLSVSQICTGAENDLRLRVWGTAGAIEWHQEEPNRLRYQAAGEAERILRRGNDYLGPAAARGTRIPAGHPEAFIEAFANIYNAAGAAMRARDGSHAGDASRIAYPTVYDGARGVHFIERAVESASQGATWVDATWHPPARSKETDER